MDLKKEIEMQLLRLHEERKLPCVSCTHALGVLANVISAKDDVLQGEIFKICHAENVNDKVVHFLQQAMSHDFHSAVDEFGDERGLNMFKTILSLLSLRSIMWVVILCSTSQFLKLLQNYCIMMIYLLK